MNNQFKECVSCINRYIIGVPHCIRCKRQNPTNFEEE